MGREVDTEETGEETWETDAQNPKMNRYTIAIKPGWYPHCAKTKTHHHE